MLLLGIGAALLSVLLSYPYDPPRGVVHHGLAVFAVAAFGAGIWVLLLGNNFKHRLLGAHGVAVAGMAILLGSGIDPVALGAALAGWGVIAGMTLWGGYLFGGWRGLRGPASEGDGGR